MFAKYRLVPHMISGRTVQTANLPQHESNSEKRSIQFNESGSSTLTKEEV